MANNLHLKFYLKGYISVKEWVYQFVDGDLEPRLVSAQPPQHLLDQGVKVSSLFRGGGGNSSLEARHFPKGKWHFSKRQLPKFSISQRLCLPSEAPGAKMEAQCWDYGRLERRALQLEQTRVPSAAARTNMGSYLLENCTLGMLPIGKLFSW